MAGIQVFALNPSFSLIRPISLIFPPVFTQPDKNTMNVPSTPLTGDIFSLPSATFKLNLSRNFEDAIKI
jgi:hypothetical protein